MILGAVAFLPRRDADGHRVHRGSDEAEVGQNVPRIVVEIRGFLDVIRALIPEFDVVGAGDIRRRCAPRIRVLRVVLNDVASAIDPERRHESRHLYEVGHSAGLQHPTPAADKGGIARFDEQPARNW